MNVKISLIIPVYNVENYLYQCLESVVTQTTSADEVIIINDGSTDRSLEICKEYSLNNKNFKLIDQKNAGLSVARNVGMRYATGDYIMFLDSDDYLRNDSVSVIKKNLNKLQCDAVFFDAEVHYDDICFSKKNGYDRSGLGLENKVMSGWDFFSKCYPHRYIVSACMAVYRMDSIRKIKLRFPEGVYYEDNFFSFVFLMTAKRIVYIPEKLYQRRYRMYSITLSNYSEKKFCDYIKVCIQIWRVIGTMQVFFSEAKKKKIYELISDQCITIISNLDVCQKEYIELDEKSYRYFFCVIDKYIGLVREADFYIWNIDLPLVNKIVKCLYKTIEYWQSKVEIVSQILHKYVKKQKKIYLNILKNLPLNRKGVRVGIYGTGKHTEGLLSLYKKMIGNIECNIQFISSYNKKEFYDGKEIINYRKIDSVQSVIVSSFLYEKDMIKKIREVNKEMPIYSFYDIYREDVFSEYKIILECMYNI